MSDTTPPTTPSRRASIATHLRLRELLARPTITVREAAEVLGIGESLAYDAVKSGEIKGFRIGNRLLVPTAPLRHLLGLEEEPFDPPAEVTTFGASQ